MEKNCYDAQSHERKIRKFKSLCHPYSNIEHHILPPPISNFYIRTLETAPHETTPEC